MTHKPQYLKSVLVTGPVHYGTIRDWNHGGEEVGHWVYDAFVVTKNGKSVRPIMCKSTTNVTVHSVTLVEYHFGMKCYQHVRDPLLSDEEHCTTDFTVVPLLTAHD